MELFDVFGVRQGDGVVLGYPGMSTLYVRVYYSYPILGLQARVGSCDSFFWAAAL